MRTAGEFAASIDHRRAAAIHDPPHIIAQREKALPDMYFTPPDFGISVLGSADGFTSDGTTAGFVLWMRGRGILVAPPAHSAQNQSPAGTPRRESGSENPFPAYGWRQKTALP